MARGVGAGLRPAFQYETEKILKHFDFMEVSHRGGLELIDALTPFIGNIPMLLHSLNLSLGSVEPPPQHRVDFLKQVVEKIDPSVVSEHLSYSRNKDIEIDSFLALPYVEEAVEVASANIRNLSVALGKPIAMENVTHDFTWPGSVFSEAEFIKRVLETADCGLLLDVTNLHINSRVHAYDPYEFLSVIPKERIVQMHVAGYSFGEGGQMMDTHSGGLHADVLALVEWTLRHTACDQVILERDIEINQFDDILPDLTLLKELYAKYRNPVKL